MAMHTGHRQRMKEKFERDGFENFADHEVLETLLFYAIPYRDTNPTAHELIDRGGNLWGALHLSEEQVTGVPLCGEHAALFLKLFAEAGRRAAGACISGESYDSRAALRQLALKTAENAVGDETYLILFDNHYRVLSTRLVFRGYYASAAFRAKSVAEPALLARASMAMLVSTHANRIARPDPYEAEASRYLARSLSLVGIKLLDHFIAAAGICTSALTVGAGADNSRPSSMIANKEEPR